MKLTVKDQELEVTPEEAIGIAVSLLMALVDEGTLMAWNLKYTEDRDSSWGTRLAHEHDA